MVKKSSESFPQDRQPEKKLVSIQVDADVLDWFQSRAKHYTEMMNQALRSYVTTKETVTTKPKQKVAKGKATTQKASRKQT